MAGRVVELRVGAREPEVGDRLAFDGVGWVPKVNIARPRGVTHVHTDTIVQVVMGPMRSPDFVTGVSGWQFDADGSLEANNITARGTIYAEAGEIAGWTLAAGHLYAGSGASRVGLKPGTYPFYAGAEAEASAPFRVNTGGEVWATNAHIAGEIDANSGHIGTLDIDGVLTVGTGTPVIQIDGPNKRIRTSDFVSGQKGWEIVHEGNAEFNNLFVRGELHAVTFVADEMHAAGGTLAVMTASKVAEPNVAADNKLPAGGVGNSFTLVVQASWDTGACYVADNHVLRIKTMAEVAVGSSLDLWDIWLEVDGTPSNNGDRNLANGDAGTFDVNCIWRQGGEANLVIPTGAAAVHWGTIGTEEGGLILTSDLNYSPYMDIFTISDATPWSSGTTPHVRVGNLDGVLGLEEEWGIAAGRDLADATKAHIILSDKQLGLWGVKQRWWDTSGNLRGEVDPSAGSSDVLFWLGPSEAGAHFKVLGTGDVWLDTLAISGDLGDFLFSKADGLLLLGPNCEINDGEWWSLRRQKATITGAFHQEAGRWLGTRGLVIEIGTINLVVNPSFETNLTNWALTDADASVTRTRSTEQSRHGTYSMKMVNTDSGDDDFSQITMAVAGSTTYTVTAWVRVTAFTAGAVANRGLWVSDGVSGWTTTITALNREWERHTLTVTTDAGASTLYVRLYAPQATVYWDSVQVEQKACATTYCDGSLGHEYTWTGTAHASTSQRATTVVAPVLCNTLVSGNNTISFRVVAQMPYDADGTWPDLNSYLFDIYGDATNRVYLEYNSDQDRFAVFINGATRLSSTVQTTKWDAGDWLDIVLTCDFSANEEHKLYINGLLEDTDNTALSAPTGIVNWHLGSHSGGSLKIGGFTFGGYAVFDRVLSATEVASIHALQRPLVDAGAMDTPGIYILDGKFRMTSSLTGNRIGFNAEEIAGFDSGGTKQFYLRASDGKAYTAGGKFVMEEAGIYLLGTTSQVQQRQFRYYYDDSGTLRRLGYHAGVYGSAEGESFMWFISTRESGDPWGSGARTIIDAYDYVPAPDLEAFVDLRSQYEIVGVGDNLALCANTSPTSAMKGGGQGVFALQNANTVPTANYTGGHIVYAQAGALKGRGSGGTVTTIAAAEPHCPVCGRDFVLEWQNEEQGTHLQVCVWCLAKTLAEAGVDVGKFVLKATGRARVREVVAQPVMVELRPRHLM